MEDLLVTLATGGFFILMGIGIAVTLMITGRNFDD